MHIPRAADSGLIATCCLLLLQACAGNGQGLDASGRPLGDSSGSGNGGGGGAITADFASIQANVFTPICSVCHVGGGAPEGLRLDEPNAYSLLVGVPSTEVPALMRVKAGDADRSYIIQKLEGTAAVGARMPLGGPYLSAATIASIRQWISAGAAAAAPPAAAFSIHHIVPGSGESLRDSPPQVALVFSHELDTTQLGGLSALLRSADGRAIRMHIAPAMGDPRVLLFTPGTPLGAGHYELHVSGPVGPQVRDERGEALMLGHADAGGDAMLSDFEVEVRP